MKSVTNLMLSRVIRLNRIIPIKTLKQEMDLLDNSPLRIDMELLKKSLINEDQQAFILAQCFGYESKDINTVGYDEKVVRMVTSGFVDKHKAIPLLLEDGLNKKTKNLEKTVYVALTDPFAYGVIETFEVIFNAKIKVFVTSASKIDKIKSLIFSKALVSDAISEYTNDQKILVSDDEDIDGADVLSAPAVKLADSIIKEGIASGASDIHIEPYEEIVRVRNRIDGVLYESTNFDSNLFPALSTRFKILSQMNIAERRIPQDGRINQQINGVDYDFRVSTLPTVYGEKIVIRILDTTAFSFTREKLGFLNKENGLIDELIQKPHGIILLTGPTGCGKSTTLYSFIKELNKIGTNIITVEDPVEYTMEGVNQVQVNQKANMTFASALRSILRQDPNIIMIGEIRDEETAEIAIRSAITGHLVLSTLHTNDAAGAVTRLIDMGIEPYFVSDALAGVIAQRLVRRLCPNCKKRILSTASDNRILGIKKSKYIYEPIGCPACNNTGYKGRVAIHEVLVMNNDLKEMILEKHSTEEIKEKAISLGMLELKDTCKEKVFNGETSVAELSSILYSRKQ